MAYNLGIDIGIASIGFAGVDIEGNTIICSGVHIFDAAENPKDGASLALPRREKRGLRRVIHRRAIQKKEIRRLLQKYDFQSISDIDQSRNQRKTGAGVPPVNPWDLRRDALVRKLEDGEFCRVLFHIAKRRGFQSNRKSAAPNDLDGKKALNGAVVLQEAMMATGATTVGEHLSEFPKKRNGNGCYDRFVTRDLLREEIKKLFEKQRKLGNLKATSELQEAYENIAFSQRPLRSSEDLVGYCSLEPEEKRAPKFSYSAELFIAWSRLNNLRIKNRSGDERSLTQDEKNCLADKAHALSQLTYKQARKELELSDDERFNISYRKIKEDDTSWEKIRDRSEAAVFLKLPGYHALKKVLGQSSSDWQRWMGRDRDKLDEVSRILSFYEDEKEIDEKLSPFVSEEGMRKQLSAITNFSKTVDLSLKAICRLLPHMQRGLTYEKACEAARYNLNNKNCAGLSKLPKFEDVRNPVVNRALAQARKVINAVIGKFGMPEAIIVELARDVGKRFEDRKTIEKQQKKNEAFKNEARKQMEEEILDGRNATGDDILKFRLWKEQEAFCCYCGAEISPIALRDPLATQIDHIIPYSRSWDDGYMNKIICHTECNQEKGNRTPYEWLGQGSRWEAVQAMARKLPARKSEKLLMEKFDDSKAAEWKERNLNDTRYMARLLKNHIAQTLALKKGVQTRNGALTAHLRSSWGFPLKTRINDRHHAIDAIVLACSTQSMVQKLSNWNKYEARKKNPAERPLPPKPWETFREDAMTAVHGAKNPETNQREGGIFVSRMPSRKITGAAHEETIRSIRYGADGQRQIVQRIKLAKLSPAVLDNLVDKESRNARLYQVLKERLDAFGGKPEKAFAETIYMPTNTAEKKGPVINSVRVVTNEKSGVEVQCGLASNGKMVRVDVFARKDSRGRVEYFLVPIYAYHFADKKLPQRAIVKGKTPDKWEVMEDKDFLFSLYKNDLVLIRDQTTKILAYYTKTDIDGGRISLITHDGDKSFGKDGEIRKGVKTLLAFEKYSVDYFGNITRIIKESRLGVACTSHSESGEADD